MKKSTPGRGFLKGLTGFRQKNEAVENDQRLNKYLHFNLLIF